MVHTFKVNRIIKPYTAKFDDQDTWEDKIYGVSGDLNEVLHDPDFPESETKVRYYRSEDGNIYRKLCSKV